MNYSFLIIVLFFQNVFLSDSVKKDSSKNFLSKFNFFVNDNRGELIGFGVAGLILSGGLFALKKQYKNKSNWLKLPIGVVSFVPLFLRVALYTDKKVAFKELELDNKQEIKELKESSFRRLPHNRKSEKEIEDSGDLVNFFRENGLDLSLDNELIKRISELNKEKFKSLVKAFFYQGFLVNQDNITKERLEEELRELEEISSKILLKKNYIQLSEKKVDEFKPFIKVNMARRGEENFNYEWHELYFSDCIIIFIKKLPSELDYKDDKLVSMVENIFSKFYSDNRKKYLVINKRDNSNLFNQLDSFGIKESDNIQEKNNILWANKIYYEEHEWVNSFCCFNLTNESLFSKLNAKNNVRKNINKIDMIYVKDMIKSAYFSCSLRENILTLSNGRYFNIFPENFNLLLRELIVYSKNNDISKIQTEDKSTLNYIKGDNVFSSCFVETGKFILNLDSVEIVD